MCGIAGIFKFSNGHPQPDKIRLMTNAMKHRGPDAEGFYENGAISLGHRRLSIIDLSEVSNQPFADRTGRFVMVFNGEIFNFRSVRNQLPEVEFRTSGDTEVLIEAFSSWGLDALKRIKGMFAFAIWDTQKQELLLARDRLGVKPLYYFLDKEKLIFSSEVRSILASGLVGRKLNMHALQGYLKYQSVCGPQSLIQDIIELPPGTYMKVGTNGMEIVPYWDIMEKKEFGGDDKVVRKHIYSLFEKAVADRMISDVPLGAFLSGGIDSSAVVGMMSRVSSVPPVTFSIGFEEEAYDETSYAAMVAKKFRTDHHSIILRPQVMLEELDAALSAMDMPTGDGINTYVVSKAVRKAGLKVALSGVGGDELFAGYSFFKKFSRLRKVQGLWALGRPVFGVADFFLKDEKWKELFRAPSTEIWELYPLLRQVVPARLIRTCLRSDNVFDPVADSLHRRKDSLGKFPGLSQVSIAEYLHYTRQTLLRDTDQMSMAVSLEVREPFFDHELIEYVLGVPDKIKFPETPKKLLVDALGDMLPPEIVHRRKQGFTFPWAEWLRTDLNQFCQQHLNNLCQRNFINADALLSLWQEFQKPDTGVKWQQIWLFVILEYWLEKNGVN